MKVSIALTLFLLNISGQFYAAASERNEAVIKDQAENICHRMGYGISLSSEGNWCCECPAGKYMAKACKPNHYREPESRVCQPCPFDENNPENQTYTNASNGLTQCLKSPGEGQCVAYMNTHREIGSATESSRCLCNEGFHTVGQTDDVTGGCQPHGSCKEGFQPYLLANLTQNTHCEICPNGTFSNITSPDRLCIPWQTCGSNQNVKSVGNGTHDTRCIQKEETANIPSSGNGTSTTTGTTTSGTPIWPTVGGGIAGLILIVLIVALTLYCCCCKKGNVPPSFVKCFKKSQKDKDAVPLQNGDGENSNLLSNNEPSVEAHSVDAQDTQTDGLSDKDLTTSLSVIDETKLDDNDQMTALIVTEVGDKGNQAMPHQEENGTCTQTAMHHDESHNVDHHPIQTAQIRFNPEHYRGLFNEEEQHKISQLGCLDCCLNKHLSSPEVGKAMLKTLKSHTSDTVLPYLRLLELGDTEIKDIMKDYKDNEQEIRYQWIVATIRMHGNKLTPKFLLEQKFELNILKDSMIDEFFKDLSVCH